METHRAEPPQGIAPHGECLLCKASLKGSFHTKSPATQKLHYVTSHMENMSSILFMRDLMILHLLFYSCSVLHQFNNSYRSFGHYFYTMLRSSKLATHTVFTYSLCHTVNDLVHWRDPKKSGVVFGVSLLLLLSLAAFSVISVVSYLLLALLCVTISFRIYKSVMQAVQKSSDGHPFK